MLTCACEVGADKYEIQIIPAVTKECRCKIRYYSGTIPCNIGALQVVYCIWGKIKLGKSFARFPYRPGFWLPLLKNSDSLNNTAPMASFARLTSGTLARLSSCGAFARPSVASACRGFHAVAMAESSSSSSASAEPSVSSSQPAVRRVRVYTRTGDKGTSSLYTGERRAKDDAVFEALGDVDELNAHVGMARELATDSLRGSGVESLISRLAQIQSRLLDAGSAIATPPDSCTPEQLARVAFPGEITRSLEQWIDEMDSELPPLRNFILPVSRSVSSSLCGEQAQRASHVPSSCAIHTLFTTRAHFAPC